MFIYIVNKDLTYKGYEAYSFIIKSGKLCLKDKKNGEWMIFDLDDTILDVVGTLIAISREDLLLPYLQAMEGKEHIIRDLNIVFPINNNQNN